MLFVGVVLNDVVYFVIWWLFFFLEMFLILVMIDYFMLNGLWMLVKWLFEMNGVGVLCMVVFVVIVFLIMVLMFEMYSFIE